VMPDLSTGETFGAYDILAVAGSGGMGIVYRAVQRSLDRIVALKLIRSDVAESGDYRSRFLREARLAAAVDHPHVVSVFDVGEHSGRLYLSMQWVDGKDLRAILAADGRLAPDRAVRLGTQLASALSAVHAAGLVHRDVKPTNILVRDIGGIDHTYLTDFGIAKMPDAPDDLTSTGWIIGTSGYMSPEQIRGEQPDARSDLYSLGCIVFQVLTGERPFAGENDAAVRWAHANGPRPVASAICPTLGAGYDAFLVRALATEPDYRFASADDFAAALEAAHRAQQTKYAAAPFANEPTELRPRQPADAPARESSRSSTVERRAVSTEVRAPAASRTADSRTRSHPGPSRSTRSVVLVVLFSWLIFIAALTVNGLDYGTSQQGEKHSLFGLGNGSDPTVTHWPFAILAALACVVLIAAVTTLRTDRRVAFPVAVVASVALILYSFYLYSGLYNSSYGPSQWHIGFYVSLAAALLMTVTTGVALLIASGDS
jgi:serine/threonine protein kinase